MICTTSDGARLAYELHGAGEPVLFIQGTGVHGHGWWPQVEELSREYACLSFDNRGVGGSDPPAGGISVESMAGDAAAVLDAAGWASAHVVGHSLGGPIALALALGHRGRVRSLALLCTLADGGKVAPPSWQMISAGLRSQIGTRRSRRNGFLDLLYPPDFLAGTDRDALARELRPLLGHDVAIQPPVVPRQLRALRACNFAPRLSELLGLPTLVISGAHDPIAPPALGRAIAEGISGAELHVFEDAAHALPIQHPRRTNELLRRHLQRATASA